MAFPPPQPEDTLLTAAAPSSGRRLPPPCWSHEETLALIDAYRDRWLSLRRGHLRAADWDAVAAAVSSSKTPVQCRHKVEKLRKRFRADTLRSVKRNPTKPPSSRWPYYPLLAAMDIAGTGATPTPPPAATSTSSSRDRLPNPNPIPKSNHRLGKRRRVDEEGDDAADEMAAAVRAIGEGFLRTEQRRMEAAREMERMRMEMELWRTEMLLDAQRQLVDAFVGESVGVAGADKKRRGFH